MKFDKEPVDDNAREDNDSSDYDDACITSTLPLPKGILSSSLSSLEGERTGVDDSDNDSGFVGISQGSLDRLNSVTPDVTNGINGSCPMAEPGTNGIYDREAIFYDLANSKDIALALSVLKIGEMKNVGKEKSKKSCETLSESFQKGRISAEEFQKPNIEEWREALKPVPDSMLHLLTGKDRPGDCGRSSDQKPDWLDMDKLRRGQKFARDHLFSVYFAQLLSLFALFSFDDGLKPLIITGKSSTPYTAFKRYLSTGLRIRNWYSEDPWVKGSAARKDILTTRSMHAAAKRRLDSTTNEEIDAAAVIPNAWCPTRDILLKDFSETCQAPVIGQCPYLMELNSPYRPKGINQLEMAVTQWGFIGLVICYPKLLGIHYATDEDLEAFCHLWRSIGYQLGMEDEYNFCRGNLEEIQQRSYDFTESWVKPNLRQITPEWEHMMRCVFVGVGTFLPGSTYETALLYLSDLLELKMPRLYASLSYKDWIKHNFTKSLFYYTIKLPGVFSWMNAMLNRALDRAEKFTPEELEAIEIKLSDHPGNYKRVNENLIGMS